MLNTVLDSTLDEFYLKKFIVKKKRSLYLRELIISYDGQISAVKYD